MSPLLHRRSILLLLVLTLTGGLLVSKAQRPSVSLAGGSYASDEMMQSTLEADTTSLVRVPESDRVRAYINEYRDEITKDPSHYDSMEISEKYYDLIGPERMLDVLEANPYCHAKAHNLGRLIYIKNNRNISKALAIAGTRCTEATFHGVLMQVFADLGGNPKHLSGSDFAKTALTFCDKPEVQKYLNEGSCVHAIGHALMFLADNDVHEGTQLCDVFPDRGRRYYCATGVFMQREKTVADQDAKVSTTYPCNQSDYPAACYRHKLRDVFPNKPDEARALCLSMPHGVDRQGCFHGLGFGFYKAMVEDPKRMTTLCSSDDTTDQKMCVEGAAGVMMLNLGESITAQICAEEASSTGTFCRGGMAVNNNGMNRDFDLYYVRR